jgi:hypothetical protein
MADWFETRFREPVDTGELDPEFVARVRALVVEEWQADVGAIPAAGTDPDDPDGDLIMLETETPTHPETIKGGPRLPGRWLLVAAAVSVVAVAGALLVADDDDDPVDASSSPSTATPASADDARFCNAIDGMSYSVSIGEGHESVDGALQAAELVAPDEIRADVTLMADESRAQYEAGPPAEGTVPKLPADAYFEATARVGDYMAGHCGYQVIDVTTTDHAFAGLPADAPGGKALIRIENDGAEYHQLLVQRVIINETRSVDEILAMPEDEGGRLLDFLGGAIAPPGMSSWTVVELTPGRRYAVMCFIPTGSTSEAAMQSPQPGSAPHSEEGMFAEVRVS